MVQLLRTALREAFQQGQLARTRPVQRRTEVTATLRAMHLFDPERERAKLMVRSGQQGFVPKPGVTRRQMEDFYKKLDIFKAGRRAGLDNYFAGLKGQGYTEVEVEGNVMKIYTADRRSYMPIRKKIEKDYLKLLLGWV